ncbi:UNVERIFIED_CONTAM: hypothetical protein GTU68_040434 [Idotea baltica]|nr:hypothetical protein [Idotea baltica]
MIKHDFLVVGGGIAGLTFALEVAKKGSVAVLFKGTTRLSSTAWAQGGIAAVTSEQDSLDAHIEDTLKAGAGLSNKKVVELVVKEAPDRVRELIEYGAKFDSYEDSYHLHQEGGHSVRRIFHAADRTGIEIQNALLKNTCALDIITSHKLGIDFNLPNRAIGVYALLDNKRIARFIAKTTLLATGGCGKVYLYTSNPDVASGDGIAMGFRAGISVANMEFMQFHPTCLYHPKAKNFLITEALRGEGAKLKTISGKLFMKDYHKDEELASRDIVARAIDSEMKKRGDDHVLLDITHMPESFIKEHFPTIYSTCLKFGIDITKQAIPVVPAAHYCCGGLVSDLHGQTSIKDLYVAGEVAFTGLHGANRLASNSLVEAAVFGKRAGVHAVSNFEELEFPEVPAWDSKGALASDEKVVITHNWDEIRRSMWNYVGIVRSDKRLERALRRINLIKAEIDDYYWNFRVSKDLVELRNLCLVAELIIRSAKQRKESIGLHYSIDYPERSSGHSVKDTVVSSLA